MSNNRRDFLKKGALLGLSGLAGALVGNNQNNPLETVSSFWSDPTTPFTLPPLPYATNALEPFIDKLTMEIHHGKHHKAYVDKLNGADLSTLDLSKSDEEKCRSVNDKTPTIIRNNLGGHYNHSLFWTLLKPNASAAANIPSGPLAESIINYYKSFDEFKKEFSDKAAKVFGSGWCWLIVDDNGRLKITTTPNQDNPLMKVAAEQGMPLLALDVWEHAYYLKYQNKRADYIANWWNVVNWEKASQLFAASKK